MSTAIMSIGDETMTDKQYQSILNLIAALVEKCKTEEETHEVAKLIREVTQQFQPHID